MKPATRPRDRRDDARMLVVDSDGALTDSTIDQLVDHLAPGDLVVVNDAATLPGSLEALTEDGVRIEVRLAAQELDESWMAVLFGEGSWTTPTEHRLPPPLVSTGDRLVFRRAEVAGELAATVVTVSSISPRLVTLRFDAQRESSWSSLYRLGVPIQYAHLERAVDLFSVQTSFAGRPWAVELPSAGRPLSFAILASLRKAGIRVVSVTHAAGLSATGDPLLDRALPLPERFEVPAKTLWAIAETKRAKGRVVAIGTSVVRALESSAHLGGASLPIVRSGMATLRIEETTTLRVVDGILTGMHAPGESHYALLGAFIAQARLERASQHARAAGYLCHEFGDTTLILPPLPRRDRPRASREGRSGPGVTGQVTQHQRADLVF